MEETKNLKVYCKNCGKEIKEVVVHRFDRNGNDSYTKEKVYKSELKSQPYIDVDMRPSLFEMAEEDSYEDLIDTILCPHCDTFPFSGSVSIYERAHVVFGLSENEEIEW